MFNNSFGRCTQGTAQRRHVRRMPDGVPSLLIWLALLAAIALMALALVTRPALASPPSGCFAAEAVIAQAEQAGARLEPLEGEAIRRAVAIYDLTPPSGRTGSDMAALLHGPEGRGGAVFVGKDGLYCAIMSVQPGDWPKLVDHVLGVRS